MRREVRLWLGMSLEDLKDAKTMLNLKRYFRAAFFSQQAVEKSFKALFFVVRRENPPHLHTVTELYRLLNEAGFSLPERLERSLYVLNKYYTVTRYPDAANGLPSESVDEEEADRAVKIAEEVVSYVESYISAREGD